METFRTDRRALVQKAVALPPDAGSEVVLGLKDALERQYEQSFGLPEAHTDERTAIRKLIALIMQAVKRAAGVDPLAGQSVPKRKRPARSTLQVSKSNTQLATEAGTRRRRPTPQTSSLSPNRSL